MRPLPDFPLFVPADHPERFAAACTSGADAVVIDLEDMVAPARKAAVRRIPHGAVPGVISDLFVRVNGAGTRWHRDDMAFAAAHGFAGVVLSKAEGTGALDAMRAQLGPQTVLIAMIESLKGADAAPEIAAAADRVAFGALDYSADLGCAPTPMALAAVRARIVQAARRAGRAAPLDGITPNGAPDSQVAADAAHAFEMGFGGKMLIDPAQVGPARAGFGPSEGELAWAARTVGGTDVGAAVTRARRILDREGTRRGTP